MIVSLKELCVNFNMISCQTQTAEGFTTRKNILGYTLDQKIYVKSLEDNSKLKYFPGSDSIFIYVVQIKLDIVPDKGWQSEDMFVPPGYHLDSTITDDPGSPKEVEQTAYT